MVEPLVDVPGLEAKRGRLLVDDDGRRTRIIHFVVKVGFFITLVVALRVVLPSVVHGDATKAIEPLVQVLIVGSCSTFVVALICAHLLGWRPEDTAGQVLRQRLRQAGREESNSAADEDDEPDQMPPSSRFPPKGIVDAEPERTGDERVSSDPR